MRRYLPAFEESPDDDSIAATYAWPSEVEHSPVLRANMVASVDGGIAIDGRVGDLGCAEDQRVLAILRDLADVILVGAGTIRAEGYGGIWLDQARLQRRSWWGLGGQPPLAVLTAGGLDPQLPIFTDTPVPPIVVTTRAGATLMSGINASVIVAGEDTVDLPAMISALADRGLRRVLCEGGPGLLGQLVAADLLAELCVTTSPTTLGAGPTRLLGPVSLPEPARWQLDALHGDGSYLFSRYSRLRAPSLPQ